MTLHIHEAMGDGDEITINDITYVDARRRVKRVLQSAPGTQTTGLVDLPVLGEGKGDVPSRFKDAEQTIAAAIVHDMRYRAIVTGIHFNSLLDTCDSCASALSILQTLTGHAVDFVYHRDYGASAESSTDGTIRTLQTLLATASALRAQGMVNDAAAKCMTARRLLTPEVLQALAIGLRYAHGDNADQLAFRVNVDYLRLLAGLVSEKTLPARAVLNALSSEAGLNYASLLGHRAPALETLAHAWADLMHEIADKRVSREPVLRVLLGRSGPYQASFLVELLNAPREPSDCRRALLNRLHAERLMPSFDDLRAIEGPLGAAILVFRLRLHQKPAPEMALGQHSVPAVIDDIRRVISEKVLLRLEADRLRTRLHELMPTVTISEQQAMREMVGNVVQNAWQKVLPGEHPPSEIARQVLDDIGPGYGRDLARSRKAARDTIIRVEVSAYIEFLRANPDADVDAVKTAFQAHVASAKAAHRQLISDGTSVPTSMPSVDTQAEALVAQGAAATTSARAAAQVAIVAQAAGGAQKAADASDAVAATVVRRNAEAVRQKVKQRALDSVQVKGLAAYVKVQAESKTHRRET